MEAYVSFLNHNFISTRAEFIQVEKGRKVSMRLSCSGLEDNAIYKFVVENETLLIKTPRQQLIDAWESNEKVSLFEEENKVCLINKDFQIFKNEKLICSEKIKKCNKSWGNNN